MITKEKIKVTFTIPTLSAGGAERVMSYVAQNLDRDKFEASLLVMGKQKDAAYPVEGIEVIFMEKDKVRDAFFGTINYLRRQKPDLVISAIVHLNTMMAAISILFPNTKFVGRETFVRSASLMKRKIFSINTSNIQKYLLDAMICQSHDMKIDMIENFNIPEEKLTTIHNPVNEKFKLKQVQNSDGITKFITVGRLSRAKGYIRILNSLAKFDSPFSYTIIGKGSYKDEIVNRAKNLGIYNKIRFIEFTNDVPRYLQTHDIFLHGSFVEGFPNSILESCAVGTPVVAFDAPGGINEIIEPGINGFIASDEDEFLQSINKVISRNFLSPEKVRKSVVDKYSADKILNDYERFIKEIVLGQATIL